MHNNNNYPEIDARRIRTALELASIMEKQVKTTRSFNRIADKFKT